MLAIKAAIPVLFGLFFAAMPVAAQTWELGVGSGAAGYMGDLNPNKPLQFSGVSGTAFLKYNIDPYWAVSLQYTYGQVEADDARSSNIDFRHRNLKFSTPLHEMAALVDFNFLEYFAGGGSKRFTPYVYTGLAGVIFNPERKVNGIPKNLRLHRTEDQSIPYRNYAVSIPYGAGLKVRLRSNFSLFGQAGYRIAFTDYLDDVGGVYHRITDGHPDRVYLANPALDDRSYGLQRGDSRKRDGYVFTQVGISYAFLCKDCLQF